MKPLILLTEAPKDDVLLPEEDDPKKKDDADPLDDDGGKKKDDADPLATDDGAGNADDPALTGTGADLDEDDEDDEDNLGDPSLDMDQGQQSDPVAEKLKRERLYDAIAASQEQCEQLSASADVLIDRIQDDVARKFAVRAKKLVDDTAEQCATIRTKFADLGYERARDLYATARERVSAVAEIIKHVIDGDDDFRKTDSGTPQRNGSAAEKGRGRSE